MMLPISRFKRYHPVGMVTGTTPWLNVTGDPTPPLLYLASWSGATYQATPPPVFYPPAVWIPDHTHLIQVTHPPHQMSVECNSGSVRLSKLFPSSLRSTVLHLFILYVLFPRNPLSSRGRKKHPRLTNQIIQRTGGHDPITRLLLCPSTLSGHVTSKANNTRDAKPNEQSSSSPLPSQHLLSTSPCHLPILSAPLTGGVSWEWAGLHRWRDKEAWPIILNNQRFRRARLKPLANLERRLYSTLQLSCVPVSQLCADKWPVLPVKVMKDIHPSLFSSKFSSRFTLLTNCRQQKRVIHGGKVSFKKGLLRKDRIPEKNQQGVTVSLFKDEDKDEDDGEDSRKDKRPVASSPVPGSPWCVVWTGDDRIFFFNPTIQLSVWERPGELTGQDISHIIQDPPHKRKKTSPVDRSSHSPDLHGDGEDDDEGEHTSKRNRTEEPMSLIHRTDLKLLPLERRITHFREMMLERGVSAFSSWEKELHKMVFDPRYLLLTLEQRKQVFDKFVKSRMKDEYKEKKSKLHKAREEFKQLLNEAKMSSRSTFKEFCVRYHGDWRFNGLSQKKEQEVLFNHYITSLKKRDKENRAKLRKMR